MKRWISVLLLLCLLLSVSGCREKAPAAEPELTPVTETVTLGDFEIRATAAGTACPQDALSHATYTVEIRYIGTEPEVTVVYGLPFEIRPDPKPLNWNVAIAGEEYRTALKPGESINYTINTLRLVRLPRRDYTIAVIVDFSAGATKALEKYSHTFRFPLAVE